MNRIHRLGLVFLFAFATSAAAQSPQLSRRLEAMAAKGNAEAMYHLGMLYHMGMGVQRDTRKAFALFSKAAAGGDPLGAYKVGCYFEGQGYGAVLPDERKALAYKLVAAKAGYSFAQYDVGAIYASAGRFADAMPWWEASAAQGYPDALYGIATLSARTDKAFADPVRAFVFLGMSQMAKSNTIDAATEARLVRMEAALSAQQKAEARRMIARYRPVRSLLTIKAMSGIDGAERLVARAK